MNIKVLYLPQIFIPPPPKKKQILAMPLLNISTKISPSKGQAQWSPKYDLSGQFRCKTYDTPSPTS